MIPYYEDSKSGIVIYHGDCREILPGLDKVDLVLTDPPYKHAHMDGGGFAAGRKFYAGNALDGLNDFDLSQYWPLLRDAGQMLVAFCSRDLIVDYAAASRSDSLKFDLHVWHKCNAIPFTANTWKSDLEYIVLIWGQKCGWKQHSQEMHSKAWLGSINTDQAHPAAKPIPLLQKYISVLDAQTILDPFMGSGTTLRAAKDLGRKAIGVEICEKYCSIAAKRLEQDVLPLFSTGQDSIRASFAETSSLPLDGIEHTTQQGSPESEPTKDLKNT